MSLNFYRVCGSFIALFWGFHSSLEASPKILQDCRTWLYQSWAAIQTHRLEPEHFESLKKRYLFVTSDSTEPEPETRDKAWLQFNKAIEFLKSSKWYQDEKKVLDYFLQDDTLLIGIDLGNSATMISSRLDKPLFVISAKDLLNSESWVHEAAHWWILNEYPQITELYRKARKDLEKHSELQVAIDLRDALQLWFEIKANEISMANSSATLESFQIYQELTEYWTKKLRLAWPDSKSKAKALRMKLKEEILSLIRWGYGVSLDEHHLKLFD